MLYVDRIVLEQAEFSAAWSGRLQFVDTFPSTIIILNVQISSIGRRSGIYYSDILTPNSSDPNIWNISIWLPENVSKICSMSGK